MILTGSLFLMHSCNTSLPELLRPFSQKKVRSAKAEEYPNGRIGPWHSGFDVTFYDLSVKFDVENRYIRGRTRVQFNLLYPTDTIQFDLFSTLIVNSVMRGNSKISFKHDKGRILIPAGGFSVGSLNELEIAYEGKPIQAIKPPWVGGFVWKEDPYGYTQFGIVCEGLGPSFWWPCKDFSSDEPDSMHINITAPSDLVVVCNGKLDNTSLVQGGNTEWNWRVNNPIATSGVTVQMGHFAVLEDTMMYADGARELRYYVLPTHYQLAKKHFVQVKKIIRFYESLFGPYPFWEDGYKLIESPYVGMEHQTAIAYGNGYSNDNHRFTFGLADYIILHETAHEWWGNSVTASDPAENWLHEGFATYCEGLFIESQLGRKKLVEFIQMHRKKIRNKSPMVGPSNVNYWNWRDDDVYSKGACFLHTLRCALHDDEQFFRILKLFATRFSKQVVSSEDLLNLVNEVSGANYTAVFNQYLYSVDLPVLEYYFEASRLYYRWRGVSGDFNMPVNFTAGTTVIKVKPTVVTGTCLVENATRVQPMANEFLIHAEWTPSLKIVDGTQGQKKM